MVPTSPYPCPMDDIFTDAQQPRCPECGTVLEDAPPGYKCRACGLSFVRTQL